MARIVTLTRYALCLMLSAQLALPVGLSATTQSRALQIDTSLQPFPWYKAHVLKGSQEHELPAEYVATIAAVEAIQD